MIRTRKVLKYGDLFNAVNRAEDAFTVLAPTNDAVLRFYEKKGVTSIEDLGYEYARTLVTYHVINDSIDREDFVKSGELPGRTLSGDALKVSFGNEGGDKSVYINKEAHVSELAIRTANGRIYVLDDVLSPAVETIYARLSDKGNYKNCVNISQYLPYPMLYLHRKVSPALVLWLPRLEH